MLLHAVYSCCVYGCKTARGVIYIVSRVFFLVTYDILDKTGYGIRHVYLYTHIYLNAGDSQPAFLNRTDDRAFCSSNYIPRAYIVRFHYYYTAISSYFLYLAVAIAIASTELLPGIETAFRERDVVSW